MRELQEYTILYVFRGHLGRRRALDFLQSFAATKVQRVYRGHLGRTRAHARRAYFERQALLHAHATKLQATWRMYVGRNNFLDRRIRELAAVQIQRVYRGYMGRRFASRKRMWEEAEPGPERLNLGIKLIGESKEAFAQQQQEIDQLHRAQQRAEARVSEIHAGLAESEQELAVLERELTDIDQLDRDLHELTHEKEMLEATIASNAKRGAAGMSIGDLGGGTGKASGMGKAGNVAMLTQEQERERAAESYALEMAIQIKRSERERRKRELEAEFASVFDEVAKKKNELVRLEASIQDMDATHKRKDHEFARLRKNLMVLLDEQKTELDNLREKGVELEAATVQSAVAAAATAEAAKRNEERSNAMFQSTEELLKFQFMSMSLGYFSSINMLKSMRDINSDTTAAAVNSSAETAATAAAAAAAANLPMSGAAGAASSMVHMQLSDTGLLKKTVGKMEDAKAALAAEEERTKVAARDTFPENVRDWTVSDVARWLDTLQLSQYRRAFKEATIDGAFLLELREEDMRETLGMSHALHVRKVQLARDKLRPLNERELERLEGAEREQAASRARENQFQPPPTVDEVFSQIRNGRTKRVENALKLGFDLKQVDENGNNALHVAAQNVNTKLVELFLQHGCAINLQNKLGNTPLHFAMAYDTAGTLGELLIERGADDMIENNAGLSPYDGLE